MAQYGRPTSDVSNAGAFTPTPLWAELDEVSPDDATTEITKKNASAGFEVALSSVTDPLVHTGHYLRVRHYNSKTNGTFDFSLYQGTTLIASYGTTSNVGTYTTHTITLTTGEAANITNYADLRCRYTANTGGGSNQYITWIELEVPTAGTVYSRTAAITGTGTVATTVAKITLYSRTAQVAGVATTATTVAAIRTRTASITGTATLNVTHSHSLYVAVVAIGSVNVAYAVYRLRTAAVTGTASVTSAHQCLKSRTVTITSTATVIVTPSQLRPVAITATGTVTATYAVTRPRTTTVTAAGSVVATVTKLGLIVLTASVTGVATVTAKGTFYRQGSYVTQGTVDVTYTVIRPASAQVTASATVDTAPARYVLRTVTVLADATVDATVTFFGIKPVTASITGVGTMNVVHTYHIWHASVSATGSVSTNVTLVSTGITYERNVTLIASGTVSVTPELDVSRTIHFVSAGSVTVSPALIAPRAINIVAEATVSTGRVLWDVLAYTGTATLVADGSRQRDRSISMSGDATLSLVGGGRIRGHEIHFIPGADIEWFDDGYMEELYFDDRYMADRPGGMVGGLVATGRLISRSQVQSYSVRGTLNATGTKIDFISIEQGTAGFSVTGTMVASGARIRARTATFNAEGFFAIAVSPGSARFLGTATMVANGSKTWGAVTAEFNNEGILVAEGSRIRHNKQAYNLVATLDCNGILRKSPIYIERVQQQYRRRRIA